MPTDLDPATLASQRCVAADDSTPRLSPDDVTRLSAGLDPAWQVLDGRLVREFAFPTFAAAFGLATRIALLAESQNHHPALDVAWGRLTVTWTTDAIGAPERERPDHGRQGRPARCARTRAEGRLTAHDHRPFTRR